MIEIFNENKKVYGVKKIKIILEQRAIFISKRTIRKNNGKIQSSKL